MQTRLLFLIIFFSMNAANAEILDGTFTETGGESTYMVNLQNDNGHVYMGTASQTENGPMIVNVTDGAGESYTGFAASNEVDGYDVYLKNPKTGTTSLGSVDVDEF